MKILRHYVGFPTIVLAVAEGGLFLLALWALGFIGQCQSCYFDDVVDLEWYEAILVTGAFLLIVAAAGLYNRDALIDFRAFAQRFVFASQLVLIPTVIVVAILRSTADVPFGWYIGILTLAIAVFFAAIFALRVAVLWTLNLNFLKRRVVILGQGTLADAVSHYVANEGSAHLRCVGRLAQGQRSPSSSNTVSLGNIVARARPFARPAPYAHMAESLHAEEIIVATNDRRGLPVDELLRCRLQGIQVTEYLAFWEREAGQIDVDYVGAGWLAFAEGFRLNLPRRAVKRVVDVVVSSLFLALTFPLLALAALFIKLDSRGPVFFSQERVGLDGKIFKVLKLRSMRVDAEKNGPQWATHGDDRVTRVGRFIRKTRIDEFPQVINVLRGDMSFIGPRPERPFFTDQIRKEIPFYDLRQRVRPGITGWAQVNYPYGASMEDAKRKLAYDLYYVKNNDTLLDMAILVQTVRVVFFGHGSR